MKLRSLFFLLIAIAFISCSDSKKQEGEDPLEYSVEVAKVVNYVTGGDIMPSSVIEVQFINGVVSEEQINQPLEINPFNFSPSIQGQAIWEGSNKLIFKPSNELDSRETYSGTLDLIALSDEFKEKTVQEVNLKFSVIGRDINIFKGDLELQNPNNPKVLVYRGKVSFNMETSLEDLKTSTTFGSKNIKWSPENSKTFSFISEGIERTSSNQNFKFQIDRDELDLETILEKTVVVTPLKEMSVTQVQQLEEGKAPAIQLQFSDNLDKTQELSGFINISPQTEFKIQQLGRFLLLEGKFKYGQSYKIELAEGIKSKWGTKTGSKIIKNVSFKDIPPQVEFASDGIFMPTTNNKRLQFMTSNLSRVHIEVKKVFNNDIENFFNREQINSLKNRNAEFRNTYISSIGAIVYNETLEIGDSKNEWLLHEVDFSGVLNEFDNGLYLVRLNFNPKDMLVDVKGDDLKFIQKHGQVFKPFTISDIGILAKWSNDKYQVFTTDLKTGKPLEGVSLQSKSRSNNYSTAVTNAQGVATLSAYKNRTVVARKDGQVSVLKPYEMKWNNSGFNVGGISTFGLETRAYIYTERGVYRPGDSINISCIARFKSNRSTSGPAYLKVFNPEGTMVIQQTDSDAEDGFYNFKIKTDENAPTGNWNANISIGNKRFYHTLKIETVVANRLKVKVDPSLRTILPENNTIDIDVEAKYLFGATAGELPYETEVEIFDVAPNFPKFKDYKFGNRNFNFQDIRSKISSGRLNSDGTVNIEWIVPSLKQSPSPLKVKITTSVSEEGGRPNHSWAYADLHPFSHYVGIKFDRWNVRLNSKNEIPVVVVNHEGESVAGREISYRIYRNDSYWWYQYNNRRDFKRKYKTDKHSFLVDEGSVTSGKGLTTIPFQPSQKGYYFIEIEDAVPQGHTSGIFVSAYPYGGIPTSDKNEGTLALLTEKDNYEVGEEATISFPSPKAGNILLTVEQGDLVLSSKWIM
ncbi:MAG: MG2 domain-containing protein, partial [bacterium]|nr:MG2 domain-containing protein [bacterium]